jgi:hypothetical protein
MDYLALLNDDEGSLEDMVCDRLGGTLISQEALEALDVRQGHAIKELLMAFDLPIEMGAAAQLMILASFFSPGATIGSMGEGNRRAGLERARALIDEILKDL